MSCDEGYRGVIINLNRMPVLGRSIESRSSFTHGPEYFPKSQYDIFTIKKDVSIIILNITKKEFYINKISF